MNHREKLRLARRHQGTQPRERDDKGRKIGVRISPFTTAFWENRRNARTAKRNKPKETTLSFEEEAKP